MVRRIVLDTGVLYRPAALRALASREEDAVLPAIAMAERVRQLVRDGRDVDEFRALLAAADIAPEALAPGAACETAARLTDERAWARLSRDAMVAAHVRPGDELWTTNAKDFIELGLPAGAVVDVDKR